MGSWMRRVSMQRFRVRVCAIFMYMQKRVKMFIFPIKRGDVNKKENITKHTVVTQM